MRMFATPEGDAGFALKGNDIVSVFKHPTAPYRNVSKSMLDLAVAQGGRRLDAFDTVLPHLYGQSGFRAVARLPWNNDYAPPGWNPMDFIKHNRGFPDVVFMAHDPQAGSYQPTDGRVISDYDEGEHHQNAALAHVDARGDVPAAPGPESYGSGQLIRMANPLTGWHGTPHEFKETRVNPLGEFDLSKLGTGEGAQAYGKGIYTGEAKGTGEQYQRDLGAGVTYKGAPPSRDRTDPHAVAVHNAAEYMKDLGMTAEQAIQAVEDEYTDAAASASYRSGSELNARAEAANRERAQFHHRVAWAAQRLEPEHFKHDVGNLYEAELHIDPEHMLHWDKPISEQSPYVRSRVAGMVPPRPDGITQTPDGRWSLSAGGKPIDHPDAPLRSFDHASTAQYALATMRHHDLSNMTGEQLHNHLSRQGMYSGVDKSQAANRLLQAGIPGIRYADQGSRQYQDWAKRISDKLATLRSTGGSQEDINRNEQYLRDTESKISHNHVVFDPRTINIVKRNGLPAMVDAGADALRDHKTSGIPP